MLQLLVRNRRYNHDKKLGMDFYYRFHPSFSGDQRRLGYYYEGKENYGKAFYWYEKAAKDNDPIGQVALALLYSNGNGVEQNLDMAMYWYQKAADQEENPWSRTVANNNIGSFYDNGIGVGKDTSKAIEYYRKALKRAEENPEVEQANPELIVKIKRNLETLNAL